MVSKQLVISDENRLLFEQIQTGDSSAIMQGFLHPGAIYRVNAIINAVKYEMQEPAIKIYLDRLKADNVIINGYKVSEFAVSALDILGLEKYSGNDIRVRRLIKSEFKFY